MREEDVNNSDQSPELSSRPERQQQPSIAPRSGCGQIHQYVLRGSEEQESKPRPEGESLTDHLQENTNVIVTFTSSDLHISTQSAVLRSSGSDHKVDEDSPDTRLHRSRVRHFETLPPAELLPPGVLQEVVEFPGLGSSSSSFSWASC
ncbi:unnamed protein product [Pleuronectes platessa]|uniref:Uncharacterized protein n=1 Tax=Pleuronectes platessa TaxID=8262 RepID=A0A9N7UKK3_PLEPL|nr:unnamed protein product [Pleuronectes platessa]